MTLHEVGECSIFLLSKLKKERCWSMLQSIGAHNFRYNKQLFLEAKDFTIIILLVEDNKVSIRGLTIPCEICMLYCRSSFQESIYMELKLEV